MTTPFSERTQDLYYTPLVEAFNDAVDHFDDDTTIELTFNTVLTCLYSMCVADDTGGMTSRANAMMNTLNKGTTVKGGH